MQREDFQSSHPSGNSQVCSWVQADSDMWACPNGLLHCFLMLRAWTGSQETALGNVLLYLLQGPSFLSTSEDFSLMCTLGRGLGWSGRGEEGLYFWTLR